MESLSRSRSYKGSQNTTNAQFVMNTPSNEYCSGLGQIGVPPTTHLFLTITTPPSSLRKLTFYDGVKSL
jgi:hypothetical protein